MTYKPIIPAVAAAVILVAGLGLSVDAGTPKPKKDNGEKLIESMLQLPDSAFQQVKIEDLLNDEVYVKLSQDGWSPHEIITIMNTVMGDKDFAKTKEGYGAYAKQWLPTYGRVPGDDSIYEFIDVEYNARAVAAVEAQSEDLYNKIYNKVSYKSPKARFDEGNIDRRPGFFRSPEHYPSSGRMHWVVANPKDPEGDQLYAIPDGAGLFKTDDCGKNWVCISDNIPERSGRSQASGFTVAVDPDDWDHVFGFMGNGKIYETTDGGMSWTVVPNAKSYGFKRGYCFRDSQGTLKFIGCRQNTGRSYWASTLWVSDDLGVTWRQVNVPNECQDDNPSGAGRGVWFQEICFDPHNRDLIYLPGSRSLLYFDDGARYDMVNGQAVFHLKRKEFRVYGCKPAEGSDEQAVLRLPAPSDDPENPTPETATTNVFPIPATSPGFMEIDPLGNPDQPRRMWFAASIRSTAQSALYYSEDSGDTWYTLHDAPAGIMPLGGYKCLFGNEAPWGWLGGFAVSFTSDWVFGCSMSSAQSSNGGKSFAEFAWGNRMAYQAEPNQYYAVSNSRHNADNHSMWSHPSGKVFRTSDGGMLMFKPTSRNNGRWENIGGNMGQMLHYNVRVNEFGDHMIIGNTQDIDVQTWRYNNWGNWRGYEGTEAFINPYGNTGYFSGGGGGGFENMSFGSWRSGTCWADVHSGSWYMQRTNMGNDNTFFRVDDVGRSVVNLYPAIGEGINQYALARDNGVTTIFIRTSSNKLMKSTDGGNTFEYIYHNGVPAVSSAAMVADPNDSKVLYFGQSGRVTRYHVGESYSDDLTYDLPEGLGCSTLIFHEGSGDLYFVNNGTASIYLLRNGSNHWEFWTKGYPSGKFGSCVINYTSQELAIHDYGRGVWVADLENPSDRFFKDGSHLEPTVESEGTGAEAGEPRPWDNYLRLKEYSNLNDRRTIGIDTKWTIPLYYYYRWWVNDEEVDNPYQYLTRELNPGDRVQLELTLRESPDVHTKSAVYIVGNRASQDIDNTPGYALHSSSGRVDIGYNDFFYRDFTVDFWLKPETSGVIMCNRQYGTNKGAKGWLLVNNGGTLQVVYSPANIHAGPSYKPYPTPQFAFSCGTLTGGEWQHIAFTESREGNIAIYINGVKTNEFARNWDQPLMANHSLNNNMCLSLFADGWDNSAMTGAIDELNIWDRQLTQDEVRAAMFAGNRTGNNGLRTYYSFNGKTLADDAEAFTGYKPCSRIRAITKKVPMLMPIDALHGGVATTEGAVPNLVTEGETKLMGIADAAGNSAQVGAYTYDANNWLTEGNNRPSKYYDITSTGYMVYAFGSAPTNYNLEFYSPDESFDPNRHYRLYYAETEDGENLWAPVTTSASPRGELTYDAEHKTLRMNGVASAKVNLKKLIIASTKPAIEIDVEGITLSGKLDIFDKSKTMYNVHASLLDNLTEPIGAYEVSLDNDVLQPTGEFYFTHGESDLSLRLDMSKIPNFGDNIVTTLSGKDGDERMMPTRISVTNRISPSELGKSVKMDGGSLVVGKAEDYAALNGTRTMTIMGWFRIDDAEMLEGNKSLMFFRNTNPAAATGIFLSDGNIRCNWANNNNNTTTFPSNFTITENDLGRWYHVAMTINPSRMHIMCNGVDGYYSRSYAAASILSPLMLGADYEGDDWFKGAFDQVAVWNRELSQAEIVKYMQERVPLNDPGLVAYMNMDYFDRDDNLRELVNGNTCTEYGTVVKHHESVVPFNPIRRKSQADADRAMNLTLPMTSGAMPGYFVSAYEGAPHNFFTADLQQTHRLNKEYYTLVYNDISRINAEGTATIVYTHPSILEGDQLVLASRTLGTVEPFTDMATATATAAGTATFTMPASTVNRATEMMVFVRNNEDLERPINIKMAFGDGIENGSRYLLNGYDWTIPLEVTVVSGADDADVSLVLDAAFASISNDGKVDMTEHVNDFTVTIDPQMLDRRALNHLTINALNATTEPLSIDFYIEPRVRLKLTNGYEGSPSQIVATKTTANLEIEAEVVDGYLEESVEITTMTDLTKSLSVGTGSLLSNEKYSYPRLEYYPSEGEEFAGWNNVPNPYLAGINLTKQQNIEYDPDKVNRFMYQYDPQRRNFVVHDMTKFNEDHRVLPFQPFFLQATQTEATVAVTPVAKQRKLDRKTFDAYSATEVNSVKVKLVNADGVCDETEICWVKGCSTDYVNGEDAPKLASIDENAPMIYTHKSVGGKASLSYDGTKMAINNCAWNIGYVPLGISAGDADGLRLVFEDNFAGGDLYLGDRIADTETSLANIGDDGVDVADSAPNRYYIKSKYIVTNIEGVSSEKHEYVVLVDGMDVYVTELLGDAQISIYNATGQQVDGAYTRLPEYQTTLTTGVYLVNIRENGKTYTTKIAVK